MPNHSPRRNCEDDLVNVCLTPYQTLFDIYTSDASQSEEEYHIEEWVCDGKLKNIVQYNENMIILEHQTKNYIAGYIIKKLNATFLKDCSDYLTKNCSTLSTEHKLIEKKDYRLDGKYSLKYPNPIFCKWVQDVIYLIGQQLPSICHHKLFSIINEKFNTNIISCLIYCSLFWKKIFEFTIKVVVNNWFTQINRILAGKINISLNETDHIKNARARYKTFSKFKK